MPVPVSEPGGAPRRSLQEMLLQPECDMRCPSQSCPVAISPSAGGRVKFKPHSVHTPLLLPNPWSSSWAGHSGLQGPGGAELRRASEVTLHVSPRRGTSRATF